MNIESILQKYNTRLLGNESVPKFRHIEIEWEKDLDKNKEKIEDIKKTLSKNGK